VRLRADGHDRRNGCTGRYKTVADGRKAGAPVAGDDD
jgi:hypothetical protein